MSEPGSTYVDPDGTPVLTERREGVVTNPIGRKRAELMGKLQRQREALAGQTMMHVGLVEEERKLLKEVALFLAYGGAASDTDAEPEHDPLKSWIGDGLRVSEEASYALRREKPGFDSGPRTVTVPDWASSAQRISTAMRHLDEALPGGQRRRTQLAILDIERGLEELKVWLREAGVIL